MFFRLLPDDVRTQLWHTTNPFTDVSVNNWFNNAVSTMHRIGFIDGFPDETFRPHNYITNAEIVTLAARFAELDLNGGTSYFTDIEGHWAERYINAVAAMGWIEAGGRFNPDQPMSRAHTAMLFNTMTNRFPVNYREFIDEVRSWVDVKDHDAWYYLHVMIATNSFYVIRAEDGREVWVSIADDIDWSVLERPTSRPGDLRR